MPAKLQSMIPVFRVYYTDKKAHYTQVFRGKVPEEIWRELTAQGFRISKIKRIHLHE